MNIFNQGVSLNMAKKQYGAHMPVLYTNGGFKHEAQRA